MTAAPGAGRYRVHPAVLAREIDGETVAVQLDVGEAYKASLHALLAREVLVYRLRYPSGRDRLAAAMAELAGLIPRAT